MRQIGRSVERKPSCHDVQKNDVKVIESVTVPTGILYRTSSTLDREKDKEERQICRKVQTTTIAVSSQTHGFLPAIPWPMVQEKLKNASEC